MEQATRRRSEGWDPYWGKLLRIDFFEGQWDSYNAASNSRAKWITETFPVDPALPVLSLACGEGGIELALARLGYKVTGIDRNGALLDFARQQAARERVPAVFANEDLLGLAELPRGNGLLCCFDTLGLLGRPAEAKLMAAAALALAPGGTLLVDGPRAEELAPGRTWWPVAEGYVLLDTRYDREHRMLSMEPLFLAPDGEQIELKDQYDRNAPAHKGVRRYIYGPDELRDLVASVGLIARVVEHQRKGYFMVAAQHPV